MRALVTGASGFAGRYLVRALEEQGASILACGRPAEDGDFFPLDLTDVSTIRAALDLAQPDFVFHLAAQTFVPESLASPLPTYETNIIGTALLAQAVRDYAAATHTMPRIIFTSSAEVYGQRDPSEIPVREHLDARPANPYAASKAAGEAILGAEQRCLGLDVVIARSFNHIGPGQSDRFVIASFAVQLAAIARGAPPELWVGNLEAARDFLDVRDVVRAYIALARFGESGETYNVSSGRALKIREVLRQLIEIAHMPVEVREDPARMRPLDVPVFVGDPGKLQAATGWHPEVPLSRSLREIYRAAVDAAGKDASPS